MLNQNVKGLLTLVLIVALLIALFAGFKSIIEPRFISKGDPDVLITETQETLVSPEIEIYTDRAVIEWSTPYESAGSVSFSNNRSDCIENTANCRTISSNGTLNHIVTIDNLEANTEYFYKIKIDDTPYPINEDEFFSFTTREAEAAQVAPSLGGEYTVEDFRQAIQEQNTQFDINNDGKVTIADLAEYKRNNQNQ